MPHTLPLDPYPLLMRTPLFRELTHPEMETLFAAAIPKFFPPATYILHQGEPATIFYIILQGRVRLTQVSPEGHQVIGTHLGPGDGLRIIVALGNMKYPVAAETVEDCLTLAWTATDIQREMRHIPQLAINGMRLIAHHFVELQDRYRELATERVERRIARAVLRLVRQAGGRTEEGVLFDIPLSRQDLAKMTGTTLYTVRIYDDFAPVAEDLSARKITSARRLGIMGGSNGGLLMGVQLTQRPSFGML